MVKNNPNKCCFCGGCVSVCPVNCIELVEGRIRIDSSKCINCGACISICPVGANSRD